MYSAFGYTLAAIEIRIGAISTRSIYDDRTRAPLTNDSSYGAPRCERNIGNSSVSRATATATTRKPRSPRTCPATAANTFDFVVGTIPIRRNDPRRSTG